MHCLTCGFNIVAYRHVAMQQRGKDTSITIEELLENGVFRWDRPEAI
jgi:hypothetical protein